jgi:hypothetical protein
MTMIAMTARSAGSHLNGDGLAMLFLEESSQNSRWNEAATTYKSGEVAAAVRRAELESGKLPFTPEQWYSSCSNNTTASVVFEAAAQSKRLNTNVMCTTAASSCTWGQRSAKGRISRAAVSALSVKHIRPGILPEMS